jgi:hypothetical protein
MHMATSHHFPDWLDRHIAKTHNFPSRFNRHMAKTNPFPYWLNWHMAKKTLFSLSVQWAYGQDQSFSLLVQYAYGKKQHFPYRFQISIWPNIIIFRGGSIIFKKNVQLLSLSLATFISISSSFTYIPHFFYLCIEFLHFF